MSRPVSEDSRQVRIILVLGGDREGVAVAERLAKDSFEVLLLGATEKAAVPTGVTAISEGILEEVHGFVGAFDVTLRTPAGRSREQVHAIVAAPPPERIPKFEVYGITPSERTVSLSRAEELADSENSLPRSRGPWFHAVFLVGLEGGSDTAVFDRAFSCAENLQAGDQVQTYVFTRHVKVADDDLERRYRELRQKGVLFFRFEGEGPRFEPTQEGTRMVFQDPLLGVEMELLPDLLVVDEDLAPSTQLRPLIEVIPSAGVFRPYLQPDSVRFLGVETPKAGILAVGGSRGRFFPDLFAGELDALSLHLKALGGNGRQSDLPGPAEVDPSRCTLCLTCVRLCPHGAIGFRKAAEVDPLSCVGCGICAVECPMRAIVMAPGTERLGTAAGDRVGLGLPRTPIRGRSACSPMADRDSCTQVPSAGDCGRTTSGSGDDTGSEDNFPLRERNLAASSTERSEIPRQIREGLSQAFSRPKVVAFLCRKSAVHAMSAAGNGSLKELVAVEVPCAGTLDQAHVLYALQNGADGVLVAACHKGNCASIYGTDLARTRVAAVGSFLEDAGLDPRMVMFVTLASNTPGELVRAARDLSSGLA